VQDGVRRALTPVATSVAAAILVIGLVVLTVAPGDDGRPGAGSDRPPVPVMPLIRP
jgi:hypothetical protein